MFHVAFCDNMTIPRLVAWIYKFKYCISVNMFAAFIQFPAVLFVM